MDFKPAGAIPSAAGPDRYMDSSPQARATPCPSPARRRAGVLGLRVRPAGAMLALHKVCYKNACSSFLWDEDSDHSNLAPLRHRARPGRAGVRMLHGGPGRPALRRHASLNAAGIAAVVCAGVKPAKGIRGRGSGAPEPPAAGALRGPMEKDRDALPCDTAVRRRAAIREWLDAHRALAGAVLRQRQPVSAALAGQRAGLPQFSSVVSAKHNRTHPPAVETLFKRLGDPLSLFALEFNGTRREPSSTAIPDRDAARLFQKRLNLRLNYPVTAA